MSRGWTRAVGGRAALLHDLGRRRWSRADAFRGRDAVVSGPAGGVVGVAGVAEAAGARPCSASTWAAPRPTSAASPARWSGATSPGSPACRLRAPMLDVETVAAGGGSILAFDGLRARVGPGQRRRRSRARPAYGRGGPATVTDANLVLGRLDPAPFPAVFGPARRRAAGRRGGARPAGRTGDGHGRGRAPRPPPRASSPSRSSRRPARSGASPPSAASIRAATPWSPSAARPARSPARWPRRWASTRCCRPRYASLLSAWGIGQARMRGAAGGGLERPLDAAGLAAARRPGRPAGRRGARRRWPRRARAPDASSAGCASATPDADAALPSPLGDARRGRAPPSRPRTAACSASSSRTRRS